MEHVSTLCATSTIGIAATGLALGRVDQTSPRSGKLRRRKTLPPQNTPVAQTNATDAAAAVSAAPAIPPSRQSRDAGLTPQDSKDNNTKLRRRSSLFAPVRRHRRRLTLSVPPEPVAEKEEPRVSQSQPRASTSSWIRRLSFVQNNGDSSRVASPSPLSPCSFGPGSPAFSRSSSQRRQPNKLVKRPPSVQLSPTSPLASPTFRGPATSYQRVGVSRHRPSHSLNFEPGSLDKVFPERPSTVDTPKPASNDVAAAAAAGTVPPFLVSTAMDGLSEHLVRKLTTSTPTLSSSKESKLRRILPSTGTAPTLVLGTSIAKKRPATESALYQCVAPPTPVTPITPVSPQQVRFENPFQSIDASAEHRPVSWLPPDKHDGQQHFISFAPTPPPEEDMEDMQNAQDAQYEKERQEQEEQNEQKETILAAAVEQPRRSSLDYTKRRSISSPLPELAIPEGTSPQTSPLLSEKRNVTDPGATLRSPGKITSLKCMLPVYMSRECRGEMGYVRDPFHRPRTSDSVSVSHNESSRQLESSSFRHRPKRHSIAASDPASTIVDSDDTRIFTSGGEEEEEETDFISEAAFDSIRTQLTVGSQCGPCVPRVQTIFDHAPPSLRTPSDDHTRIEDIIQRSRLTSRTSSASQYIAGIGGVPPPPPPRSYDEMAGGPFGGGGESSRLSLLSDITDDDEETRSLVAALPNEPYALRSRDVVQIRNDSNFSSASYGPHNSSRETLDSNRKMNIFDWSEKPGTDREVSGQDPRPRTVHGKQGLEGRVPGHKPPSTRHLRSQSVPGSRDPSLSSESRQSSGKFGAWGLGGKGVSEDWDNDFEFDEDDGDDAFGDIGGGGGGDDEVMETSRSMTVPKSIMDRQASLHGQFGQVQELTLLVEELKRLRHQASILDIVHGPSSDLWKEAEGIINLATVDEEDNNPSPPRSPSSLTFSFDDSDDEEENTQGSKGASQWPASIEEAEEEEKGKEGGPVTSNENENAGENHGQESSSSKAKSVLDMIYQQRESNAAQNSSSRPKKLAFDTQSLRDLVIRAGVVTRALKEVIRKAEGVSTTPDKALPVQSNPAFSRIFDQASNDDDAFAGFDHPLR